MICFYPNQQFQVTAVSLALQIFKQSIINRLTNASSKKKYQSDVYINMYMKIVEVNQSMFCLQAVS